MVLMLYRTSGKEKPFNIIGTMYQRSDFDRKNIDHAFQISSFPGFLPKTDREKGKLSPWCNKCFSIVSNRNSGIVKVQGFHLFRRSFFILCFIVITIPFCHIPELYVCKSQDALLSLVRIGNFRYLSAFAVYHVH